MRITNDQVIAGVSAARARDFARFLASWDDIGMPVERLVHNVVTEWGLTRPAAKQFVDAFVAEGFAEPSRDGLVTTVAGNALSMASARKPVLRRTADKAITDLLVRAEAINADPGYLLSVEWLEIFGSYLDPQVDRLGDVDVYYRLARRYHDTEWTERCRDRVHQARANGRRFPTFASEVIWPETEVKRTLRGRSGIISLMQSSPQQLRASSKIIFPSTARSRR